MGIVRLVEQKGDLAGAGGRAAAEIIAQGAGRLQHAPARAGAHARPAVQRHGYRRRRKVQLLCDLLCRYRHESPFPAPFRAGFFFYPATPAGQSQLKFSKKFSDFTEHSVVLQFLCFYTGYRKPPARGRRSKKEHTKGGWIMQPIRIGFAPTRRSIFSAPDAVKYRNLTAARLRELGVDFVDIDDINAEGLLYDEDDRLRILEKFRAAGVDGLFLPHCNFGTEYLCSCQGSERTGAAVGAAGRTARAGRHPPAGHSVRLGQLVAVSRADTLPVQEHRNIDLAFRAAAQKALLLLCQFQSRLILADGCGTGSAQQRFLFGLTLIKRDADLQPGQLLRQHRGVGNVPLKALAQRSGYFIQWMRYC